MSVIKFAKVKDGAIVPSKEKYNAGYDIYPCFEEKYMIIEPHTTKLVPTGIASIIPDGYYMQIQERGSSGSKGIKYGAGVIDSGYRGEWFLATTNTNQKPIIILKKEADLSDEARDIIEKACIVYPYEKALFQAVVHDVHNEFEVEEITAEELKNSESERGSGCLGSSGK